MMGRLCMMAAVCIRMTLALEALQSRSNDDRELYLHLATCTLVLVTQCNATGQKA